MARIIDQVIDFATGLASLSPIEQEIVRARLDRPPSVGEIADAKAAITHDKPGQGWGDPDNPPIPKP